MAGARSRRAFLWSAAAGAAALVASRARAEDTSVVGLVLPPGGAATAVEQGAALGLDEANTLATLFGKRLRLESESAADRAGAARAATALGRAGAIALVGGAGAGYAEALRDAAATAGALFMNVAAPDDRLRQERCERQTFHLIPSVTMCVDALALWADRRRLARWAILGDGSPRAREIEAAARRALARRPGAGVAAEREADLLLLAGEAAAALPAIARARAEGRADALAGIGGEGPDALAAEDAAGAWVVGWHRDLERFSASELNTRFRRRFARPLTESSWAAWAALKLTGEALVRAAAGSGAGLRAYVESSPPFGPRRRGEGSADGGFATVAELPGPNLDAIGTPAAESRCRLDS